MGQTKPMIDTIVALQATSPNVDESAAITNANAPDAANPFATMADVGGGGSEHVAGMLAGNPSQWSNSLTPGIASATAPDTFVIAGQYSRYLPDGARFLVDGSGVGNDGAWAVESASYDGSDTTVVTVEKTVQNEGAGSFMTVNHNSVIFCTDNPLTTSPLGAPTGMDVALTSFYIIPHGKSAALFCPGITLTADALINPLLVRMDTIAADADGVLSLITGVEDAGYEPDVPAGSTAIGNITVENGGADYISNAALLDYTARLISADMVATEITDYLLSSDENDALAAADSPGSSNPFLTESGGVTMARSNRTVDRLVDGSVATNEVYVLSDFDDATQFCGAFMDCRYQIIVADQMTPSFTVAGDWSNIADGDTISVRDSTGNDMHYTVLGPPVVGGGTTTITVFEPIVDGTPDGYVSPCQFQITAVNQPMGRFTVQCGAGQSISLADGDIFWVLGSSGNDGRYHCMFCSGGAGSYDIDVYETIPTPDFTGVAIIVSGVNAYASSHTYLGRARMMAYLTGDGVGVYVDFLYGNEQDFSSFEEFFLGFYGDGSSGITNDAGYLEIQYLDNVGGIQTTGIGHFTGCSSGQDQHFGNISAGATSAVRWIGFRIQTGCSLYGYAWLGDMALVDNAKITVKTDCQVADLATDDNVNFLTVSAVAGGWRGSGNRCEAEVSMPNYLAARSQAATMSEVWDDYDYVFIPVSLATGNLSEYAFVLVDSMGGQQIVPFPNVAASTLDGRWLHLVLNISGLIRGGVDSYGVMKRADVASPDTLCIGEISLCADDTGFIVLPAVPVPGSVKIVSNRVGEYEEGITHFIDYLRGHIYSFVNDFGNMLLISLDAAARCAEVSP